MEIPLKTANQPVMARCHSELLKVPPRSPDFILLRTFSMLYLGRWKDAIDQRIQTRKSYQEFCNRVRRTIYSISHQLIDKTVECMNTRIADKIRNNGERLNY